MIGERFYARKSISLPRQHQHRLREDIQTEIKIIHALDHPHVVRVLFTYEETRSFSIIMHPLADCDLETYLITKTCVSAREESLIWKWMACLVNTLAFIHSKDIRHKDIKPRNVLIKGEKVYFTDFGSGHIFSDGGNSTTEGLAYGHTRAYCAPEVIKNDTRNRSSDVFSLGCVLMEMAAWSSKISRSNYFLGLGNDEDNADSVQYHSVLNRIKTWFEVNPSLTRRSKELYSEVLKHMLRTKPDLRWSAVKVSCAIGKIVSPPECVKCGIDLWVPGSFVD
jgi:serine/threonine protein kinase